MKATHWFTELLVKLRIFDNDYTVSFTSLYLYVGLFICIVQPATIHVIGLLSLIFANVQFKRLSRHKAQALQDQHNAKMQELSANEAKAEESNSNELAQLKSRLDTLTQIVNLKK